MPSTMLATLYTLITLAARLTLAQDWVSPPYNYLYQFEMPIPPTKQPLQTFTFPNGPPIDYFEVDIKAFESQIYPNLGKTRFVGYDGQAPGPTFEVQQGREAIVRFVNHSDRENSVHLHGSYSRAPFDGWADDTSLIGQFKDYCKCDRPVVSPLLYEGSAHI
jgi:bilirubin oxidase